MENEVTEIAGLKLHWPELGHVLRTLPDQKRIPALISTYGEIRLLYAIFLVDGIQDIGDEVIRQEAIVNALAENWLSNATQARLLQFHKWYDERKTSGPPNGLPIPWLSRYGVTPQQAPHVEKLSEWQLMGGGYPPEEEESWWSIDKDIVRPFADAIGVLHADLRPDTLIMWLHFLMEGDSDPRLKAAYARHRPDLNLDDYWRCDSAWSALGFKRARSSRRRARRELLN